MCLRIFATPLGRRSLVGIMLILQFQSSERRGVDGDTMFLHYILEGLVEVEIFSTAS